MPRVVSAFKEKNPLTTEMPDTDNDAIAVRNIFEYLVGRFETYSMSE